MSESTPQLHRIARTTWQCSEPHAIIDGLLKAGYGWAEAKGVGTVKLTKGANAITVRLSGGFITANGDDALTLLDLAAQLSQGGAA